VFAVSAAKPALADTIQIPPTQGAQLRMSGKLYEAARLERRYAASLSKRGEHKKAADVLISTERIARHPAVKPGSFAGVFAQTAKAEMRLGNVEASKWHWAAAGEDLVKLGDGVTTLPHPSTPAVFLKQARIYQAAENAFARAGNQQRVNHAWGRAIEAFTSAGQFDKAQALRLRGPRQVPPPPVPPPF